ncbi:hypothetical protein N7452_005864 [Penicillium brevicompactum]|uniref:Uncharacterized protein n=1 Tax=Penicillium brevicompactum TaxID=5074 RepID=A0A9W9QJI1_PENBR|nr:hypothetical protein N7452_005864 [Penicillium brevicompactum]
MARMLSFTPHFLDRAAPAKRLSKAGHTCDWADYLPAPRGRSAHPGLQQLRAFIENPVIHDPGVIEAPEPDEMDPWLCFVDWPQLLAGLAPDELLALLRAPPPTSHSPTRLRATGSDPKNSHTWWVQSWEAAECKKDLIPLVKYVPEIIERTQVAITGPSGDPRTEKPILLDVRAGIAFKGAGGDTKIPSISCRAFRHTYNPRGLPYDATFTCNTDGLAHDAVVTCILLWAWELGQDNFDVLYAPFVLSLIWIYVLTFPSSRTMHASWRPARELSLQEHVA